MIMFTNLLMGAILLTTDHFYPFITDELTGNQALQLLIKYTISSLSAAAMALIPLFSACESTRLRQPWCRLFSWFSSCVPV